MFDTDPLDIDGQAEAQARTQAEHAAARLTFAEDIRALMSTPGGRRIVWWMLAEAGIYRQSYTGQANDTIFNEGKRSIGLRVLAATTVHAPATTLLMLNEGAAS